MDLNKLSLINSTFWSLGNDPTQRVNNLHAKYISYHLKLLYLLSDKILASSSFYFESALTREVTNNLLELFESGEILYFIDEDLEDFEEHGLQKIKKSPTTFSAYNNKSDVLKISSDMNSKFIPLRRPKKSISDQIVELWIEEVNSKDLGTIGGYIAALPIKVESKVSIQLHLVQFAELRKKDFVWEYILPLLIKLKVPKGFRYIVRRKLSMLYSIATTQVLGLTIDNNNLYKKSIINKNLKFDTVLFDECLNIIGLRKAMESLTLEEIVKLKYSEAFVHFKEFYFTLIAASSYQAESVKSTLPIFKEIEKSLSVNGISIENFTNTFKNLFKRIKISHANYKKPLDLIKFRYETFHITTIDTFVESINQDFLPKILFFPPINSQNTGPMSASEFVDRNIDVIEKVIVNNFQIAKTVTGGQYNEMIDRTIKWFTNFSPSEFEMMLLIYKNIKYYSEANINNLLDNMASNIKKIFKNNLSKVLFSGLGNNSAGSGHQFLYRLNQRLGLPDENFPNTYKNIDENINAIVFIDDIIGSGNQAIKYFKKNLTTINIDTYYFSILAFEEGIQKIRNNTGFKGVFCNEFINHHAKIFTENAEIFAKENLDKVKLIAESYGEKLYPSGKLGYDDSQALIVFSHNTPNNTLPIIWAGERNEKSIEMPWNPLFERKKN